MKIKALVAVRSGSMRVKIKTFVHLQGALFWKSNLRN